MAPFFLASCEGAGINTTDDFNKPGGRVGAGYYHFAVRDGVRDSAARAMLGDVITGRDVRTNLDIVTGAHVNRVLLEGGKLVRDSSSSTKKIVCLGRCFDCFAGRADQDPHIRKTVCMSIECARPSACFRAAGHHLFYRLGGGTLAYVSLSLHPCPPAPTRGQPLSTCPLHPSKRQILGTEDPASAHAKLSEEGKNGRDIPAAIGVEYMLDGNLERASIAAAGSHGRAGSAVIVTAGALHTPKVGGV